METANKSEAERCLGIAVEARKGGDIGRARRLASKSLRLCFTQQAKGKFAPCTLGDCHVSVIDGVPLPYTRESIGFQCPYF